MVMVIIKRTTEVTKYLNTKFPNRRYVCPIQYNFQKIYENELWNWFIGPPPFENLITVFGATMWVSVSPLSIPSLGESTVLFNFTVFEATKEIKLSHYIKNNFQKYFEPIFSHINWEDKSRELVPAYPFLSETMPLTLVWISLSKSVMSSSSIFERLTFLHTSSMMDCLSICSWVSSTAQRLPRKLTLDLGGLN